MLIKGGRVQVNHVLATDAEFAVEVGRDLIAVDGQPVEAAKRIYVMLNKPRGLVTTAADEQGRRTVFDCLREAGLPRIVPVGRLDMASEGLLLFTNDNDWAAQITAPATHIEKTYHVQVDCLADQGLLQRLTAGVTDQGEVLMVKRATVLRQGTRNSWLEIVLDEGKNRHLRRLLGALDINVLRLIRVAVGSLPLGTLAKGKWRCLTVSEVQSLANPSR